MSGRMPFKRSNEGREEYVMRLKNAGLKNRVSGKRKLLYTGGMDRILKIAICVNLCNLWTTTPLLGGNVNLALAEPAGYFNSAVLAPGGLVNGGDNDSVYLCPFAPGLVTEGAMKATPLYADSMTRHSLPMLRKMPQTIR